TERLVAIAVREREARLEPVERREDKDRVEACPAEVDGSIAAVGRTEPEPRPGDDLDGDRGEPENQRAEALEPPRRPAVGLLIRAAPGEQGGARGEADHDDDPPPLRRVHALRLERGVRVERAEVEVREEKREEEEHERAR